MRAMQRKQIHWRFSLTLILVSLCTLDSGWFAFSPTPTYAAGTTCYVATTGNDSNNGTSLSSPQHIQNQHGVPC